MKKQIDEKILFYSGNMKEYQSNEDVMKNATFEYKASIKNNMKFEDNNTEFEHKRKKKHKKVKKDDYDELNDSMEMLDIGSDNDSKKIKKEKKKKKHKH